MICRTSSGSFRTHSDKNAELTPQGEVHLQVWPSLKVSSICCLQHSCFLRTCLCHAKATSAYAAAPQVCTIQESDADNRKFYVNSGTSSIRLRAETEYVLLTCLITLCIQFCVFHAVLLSYVKHPGKTQMMIGVVFASCRDDRQAWLGALQKSKVLHSCDAVVSQMLSDTTSKKYSVTMVRVNAIPAVIQSFLALLLVPEPFTPLHNPAMLLLTGSTGRAVNDAMPCCRLYSITAALVHIRTTIQFLLQAVLITPNQVLLCIAECF